MNSDFSLTEPSFSHTDLQNRQRRSFVNRCCAMYAVDFKWNIVVHGRTATRLCIKVLCTTTRQHISDSSGFDRSYWHVTFCLDVSRTTKRRRNKTQRTDNAIETYFCLLICHCIMYFRLTFKHFWKNLEITRRTKDVEDVARYCLSSLSGCTWPDRFLPFLPTLP